VYVSELNPERALQVRDFGADIVVNPADEDLSEIMNSHTKGTGVDVTIVAAPAHKAQQAALEVAAIGGRINFFAGLPKDNPTIDLNSNLIHYKELKVTGTTASSTQNCQRAAEIVNSGRIDLSSLISTRFPLSEALDAFSVAETGKALKVVLEP
jgi:L-iditol 2-dehydrogenase